MFCRDIVEPSLNSLPMYPNYLPNKWATKFQTSIIFILSWIPSNQNTFEHLLQD